jgi:hypothetical protein
MLKRATVKASSMGNGSFAQMIRLNAPSFPLHLSRDRGIARHEVLSA